MLLPADIDGALSVAGPSPSTASGTTNDIIPAPSRNWRRQFRRHLMLNRSGAGASTSAAAMEKPPPKPLRSYFFQISLILYQKEKGNPGKGKRVGEVTRLFQDVKMVSKTMDFEMNDLGEEMSSHEFTTFDIRVSIFDKASGKQAMLHEGGLEDFWDDNLFCFGYTHITNAFKFDTAEETGDAIEARLFVSKSGCTCRCLHYDDAWNFFDMPTLGDAEFSCGCCRCDKKWTCFWDMTVELSVIAFMEWDVVEFEETEQLRIIEECVDFM